MEKTLKILTIYRWPVGGIRSFTQYIYKNIPKNLNTFTIVCPNDNEFNIIKNSFSHLNHKFIQIDPNISHIRFFLILSNEILKNKYDIVHSHGLTSAICSFLAIKLSRSKSLISVHETITYCRSKDIIKRIRLLLIHTTFIFSNKIHCVSYDVKLNLLSILHRGIFFKKKLIVIPNGIDVSLFSTIESIDFRDYYALGDKTFLIGFFGRFMKEKGFRVLVDAIEKISKLSINKKVLVLSFGWGAYIREDQEYIRSKGIESHFLFLPFTTDVCKSIRGLDLVVMPSIREAFGLLAAETLGSGIPLIGTNCIGLREVLRNTPARIVKPSDPESLYKGILDEIQSPTKDKAAAYRKEALKRFDIKISALLLYKLFNKLRTYDPKKG